MFKRTQKVVPSCVNCIVYTLVISIFIINIKFVRGDSFSMTSLIKVIYGHRLKLHWVNYNSDCNSYDGSGMCQYKWY